MYCTVTIFSLTQFNDIITAVQWDCLYCGKEHSYKEERRLHVQLHCMERPEWRFSCLYFGKKYSSQRQLAHHVGRWCKDKP